MNSAKVREQLRVFQECLSPTQRETLQTTLSRTVFDLLHEVKNVEGQVAQLQKDNEALQKEVSAAKSKTAEMESKVRDKLKEDGRIERQAKDYANAVMQEKFDALLRKLPCDPRWWLSAVLWTLSSIHGHIPDDALAIFLKEVRKESAEMFSPLFADTLETMLSSAPPGFEDDLRERLIRLMK